MNHDEMLQTLAKNTCLVEFTKVNGEKRVMTCTRSLDLIPEMQRPKSESKPPEGYIPVYDLKANGWRSFKDDSVISFEVIL